MGRSIGAGLIALILPGQASELRRAEWVTYVFDFEGRPAPVARATAEVTPGGRIRSESVAASVNSRPVKLRTVEQRLIRQGPGERVVEILIQPYDQDGRPGPPERIVREERTGPDGRRTERTSVYRADLNGRFSLAERSTTTAFPTGNGFRSETSVERPSINGAFEVSERRSTVETRRAGEVKREVAIEQAQPGAGFRLVAKEVTETVRSERRETSRTVRYNTAATGTLGFAGQTVSEIERGADGSETALISIYGVAAPGRPAGSAGEAFLREQQRIERFKGSGGVLIERFSIRRPSLADQRLGSFIPISEAVCKGDCEDAPPPSRPAPLP